MKEIRRLILSWADYERLAKKVLVLDGVNIELAVEPATITDHAKRSRLCPTCQQAFPSVYALHKHYREAGHGKRRQKKLAPSKAVIGFDCPTCHTAFSTAYFLRKHQEEKGHGKIRRKKLTIRKPMSPETRRKIAAAVKERHARNRANGHTTIHHEKEAQA